MIKFEGHQTFDQKLKTVISFILVFDGRCFVRVSNMFDAAYNLFLPITVHANLQVASTMHEREVSVIK